MKQNRVNQLALAKTDRRTERSVGELELPGGGGATARSSREAANWERCRRRGLSGENLEEILKQFEEPFRFAGNQAVAVKKKDLEEEGEERASAGLKSVARVQVEAI
jgi:hypothetical protein